MDVDTEETLQTSIDIEEIETEEQQVNHSSSSSSSSSSYDISVAEFIRLLQSEGEELLSGLKRCRDAIARGGGTTRELDEITLLKQEQERKKMDPIAASRIPLGGRVLVTAYLKTSPDAKELTSVWDALGKNNAGRAASLVADLAGAIIAFASDDIQATLFARSVLKLRAKNLQAALASSSPRLVRCVLKLMTAAARISPALAREVTRRVPLATKVIEALAVTRHDTGLSTTSRGTNTSGIGANGSSGKQLGILTKKAANSAKRAQSIDALSDPSAIAKHVFLHGRQDDDVRSCFVKYACALMSSNAPDVVKETVRSKGLIFSILKGLQKDAASVVVEALGSLGDALLLSGSAIPLRTLQDVLNPNAIAMLVGLYSRGAPTKGESTSSIQIASSASSSSSSSYASNAVQAMINAEADIRPALHVFLVAITTGKLDLGAATIAMSKEPLMMNSNFNIEMDSGNFHQRKKPRLIEGGFGETGEVRTVPYQHTSYTRSVPCVFVDGMSNSSSSSSSASALVATAQRTDAAAAASNAATAALAAAIGGNSSNGIDIDEEDEASRRSLAVIDALSTDRSRGTRARNSSSLAVASAASSAEGSADYDIGALAVLLQVRAAEDALQADLLYRMLTAHPGLVGPYLRAFPFSLESRASNRWVQNISLFNSVVGSPGSVLRPFVLLRTALVTLHDDNLSLKSSSTRSNVNVTASAVAVGDTDGSIGGIPLVLLVRAAIPSASARAIITRSILHSNPAITFHGLSLLQSLLLRLERFISEACDLVPFVPTTTTTTTTTTTSTILPTSMNNSDSQELSQHSSSSSSSASSLPAVQPIIDQSSLSNLQRSRAINDAVQSARSSRAAQLARAFAGSLPDILTIVALHARITALCSSTSTEEIDLSMTDGVNDVNDEDGKTPIQGTSRIEETSNSNMIISGLTISTNQSNTRNNSMRILPSSLGHMLRSKMLTTLNLYIRVLPAAALVSTGGIVISTPSGGGSGGGGGGGNGPATFDLLKLAHSFATLSPLNTDGEHGTAALLRLLLSTGPPSHSDVSERWLIRPKVTAAVIGAQPLLLESVSSSSASTAAISAATLATSKAKKLAAEQQQEVSFMSSSSSSSSSSLSNALRSESDLVLDIAAAHQPSVFSSIASFLISSVSSTSTSTSSFYQKQALAIRLIRRCCLACADSTASLRFSMHVSAFRVLPLALQLKKKMIDDTSLLTLHGDEELAMRPFARLLTNLKANNEADVWINVLSTLNKTRSYDDVTSNACLTAFSGLVWATAMDVLLSPAVVAASLPKIARLNAQNAARAAPFTIRAWLAFCRGLITSAEQVVETLGEGQSEEQAMRISSAIGELQTALCIDDTSGGDLDGKGGEGSTVRSGGTQKSALVTAGANSITKLLLHTRVVHYLFVSTQEILLQLNKEEQECVRNELERFLTPTYNLLSVLSADQQQSSTSGSGKKKKNKNKGTDGITNDPIEKTGPGSELLQYVRPLLSQSMQFPVNDLSRSALTSKAFSIIKASLISLPMLISHEDDEDNTINTLGIESDSSDYHTLSSSLTSALVQCAAISIDALTAVLPTALLVCDKVLVGDFSPITQALYSLPSKETSVFALRPIAKALDSNKQGNTDKEEDNETTAVLESLPINSALYSFFQKSISLNASTTTTTTYVGKETISPSIKTITKASGSKRRRSEIIDGVVVDESMSSVVTPIGSNSKTKKLKKSLVLRATLRFLESSSLPATLLFDHLLVGKDGKYLRDAACRRIAATAFLRQHCVLVPESSLDYGKGGGGLAYLDNASLEEKSNTTDTSLLSEHNVISLLRIIQSLGAVSEQLVTVSLNSPVDNDNTAYDEAAAFALNLVSILLELSSGGAGHRISRKAAEGVRTISHSSTPSARPDVLSTSLRLVLSRSSIHSFFASCMDSTSLNTFSISNEKIGQRSFIDAIAAILRAASRPFAQRSSFIRDKTAFAAFDGQTSAALFEHISSPFLQQLVEKASPELLLSLKGDSAISLLSLLTAKQQAIVLTSLSLSKVIKTAVYDEFTNNSVSIETKTQEDASHYEILISTVLIPLLTTSSPLTSDDALFRLVSFAVHVDETLCPSVDLFRQKVAQAVVAATSIVNSKSNLVSSLLLPSAEKLSTFLISSNNGGLENPGSITLLQALALSFTEVRNTLGDLKILPEVKKGKGMITIANLVTSANASVAGLATGEGGNESSSGPPKEVAVIFGLLPALASQSLIKTKTMIVVSPVIALLASIGTDESKTTMTTIDSSSSSSSSSSSLSASNVAISGNTILRDSGLALLQHSLFPSSSIGIIDTAMMDSIFFSRAAVFRALRTKMTPLLLDATTKSVVLSGTNATSTTSLSDDTWPLNEHLLSALEVTVAAALATANSSATGNASAKASKSADRFLVTTSRLLLLSVANLAARTKKVKKGSTSKMPTTVILTSTRDVSTGGASALPSGLTQALLQRTIFLALEILSRLSNSWWRAAALDDNKWTSAAGFFARAVLLPPPVALTVATTSAEGDDDIVNAGENDDEEEEEGEEEEENDDEDEDDTEEMNNDDEEEEEEEIIEGVNLASVSGILSILDAVVGRLSGCGKVLSRDVTISSNPTIDDVITAAISFSSQPSTQNLSAFSSLSAFIRHPSFLHLLLRDRYLAIPGLAQGSVATYTTGGFHLDNTTSTVITTSSFTLSSLFRPTALVLDLAIRRQRGGRAASSASSGYDISIGLPSILDSARLSSSRLLLRLALLLTPAVVTNSASLGETQARRDNRPLWLVSEARQKSLLVTSFLPLLPVVCAAYTASLSPTDRLLRRILKLFETGSGEEGESGSSHPARVGFSFSAGAVSHVFWSSKLFGWRAASRSLPSATISSSSMEIDGEEEGGGGKINGKKVVDLDPSLALKETTASANPQLATSLEWFFAGEKEGQEGALGGSSNGASSNKFKNNGKKRGGFSFAVKSYQKGGRGGFGGRQRTSAGQRWLAQRAARGASSRVSALRLAASSAPRMFSGAELAGAQTGLLIARVSASLSHFPVHRRFDASDDAIISLSSSSSFENEDDGDTLALMTSATEQQRTESRVVSAARAARQELALLSRSRFGDDLNEFATQSSSSSALIASKTGGGLVGVTAETLHLHTSRERIRATIYDPSFILPALLFVCASGRLASHVKKFANGGALTFALAATTSSDPTVRQAAYAVLGAYVEAATSLPEAAAIVKALLGGSAIAHQSSGGPSRPQNGPHGGQNNYGGYQQRLTPFRELPQVLVLLTCLKNSVKEPFQRLPTLHAAFVAEALHVVLRPAHPLYALINSYILKKGSLDLDDAPMLYELAGSSSSKAPAKNNASSTAALLATGGADSAPRQWLLRVLGRAMRCAADHACMRRRHGYFLLMSLATSPQSESEAQAAALSPSGSSGPPGTGLIMRTALGVLLTAARTRMPKAAFQRTSIQRRQVEEEQVNEEEQEEEEEANEDTEVVEALGVSTNSTLKMNRAGGFGDDIDEDVEDQVGDEDEEREKAKQEAASIAKKALDTLLTSRQSEKRSIRPTSHHEPPPVSTSSMTVKEMPLSAAAYLRRSCQAIPWVTSLWAKLRSALTLTHTPILLVEQRRDGIGGSGRGSEMSNTCTGSGSSSSSSSSTSGAVRMVVAGSPAPLDVLLASAELLVLMVRSASLSVSITQSFPAGISVSSITPTATIDIDVDEDTSNDEEAREDNDNDDEEEVDDFVFPSVGTGITSQETRKTEVLMSTVAEALSAFSHVIEASALVLERLSTQVNQGTTNERAAHSVCTVLLQQAVCPIMRELNAIFNVTRRVKVSKLVIDSIFQPFIRDTARTSVLKIREHSKKLFFGEGAGVFAITDELDSCVDSYIQNALHY